MSNSTLDIDNAIYIKYSFRGRRWCVIQTSKQTFKICSLTPFKGSTPGWASSFCCDLLQVPETRVLKFQVFIRPMTRIEKITRFFYRLLFVKTDPIKEFPPDYGY